MVSMKSVKNSSVVEVQHTDSVSEISETAIDQVTGAGCWVQGGGSGGVGLYHHSAYIEK